MARPLVHRTVRFTQHPLLRSSGPGFMLPTARPMREPGTNYLTYITADGPRTYHPQFR